MTKSITVRAAQAIGMSATLLGAGAASAASIDAAPGFFFSTLPFSDTGTTIGAVSDINAIPAGISTYPTVAGPDVFYRFFVTGGGSMSFQVSILGATGFDPAIYLLKDGTQGSNAVIGQDTGVGGVSETFTTNVTEGWYYFVVDSFYATPSGQVNRHAGEYALEVTGSAALGIPEPGAAGLLGAAVGLAAWRRRRTVLLR